MINKFKNFFYLIFFFTFLAFTANFYFSDKNIKETNKSRSFYSVEAKSEIQNLPFLPNDTQDIIFYTVDIEKYKKKKKNYTFWDLIGK